MCGIAGWVDFGRDLTGEGAAAQAMTATMACRGPDGDPLVVLSYSGEVCNFKGIREELVPLGHRFRTRSDTEVVLRSYLEWGTGGRPRAALTGLLDGMRRHDTQWCRMPGVLARAMAARRAASQDRGRPRRARARPGSSLPQGVCRRS
ncbi:hypothetical protein ABT001_29420 [Streptomyces sp. NPDC002793]|uniref:hypothetical protein n=1 Tax=Streptomyces sp. NPDC002793 TaxID=3154432 RepID=UPI00332414D5